MRLSNPVLLGIVNASPLNGSIVIEMAQNLGYVVVDRMLGGKGVPLDKPRDFSEIELLIMSGYLIVAVDLLVEPWENVCEVRTRLERIEHEFAVRTDYIADGDDSSGNAQC